MGGLPGPGPAAERRAAPWSRAEKLALALFVLGLGLSLGWLVHGWYDPMNDAAMYLLTARSLAAGEGYTMLGQPFLVRPPGFSLLLAPLVAAFGTDFHALHLMVAGFGALACALSFAFQRARVGWVLALVSALAVWLNPAFQRFCNQVMSDAPGAGLLFACLLLERWCARRPSPRRELLLGLALGLATLVRSMVALLVPALLAARLLERLAERAPAAGREPFRAFALRRLALPALAALAALAPWIARNASAELPTPVDQTYLYSYSTGMWHADPGDPRSRLLTAGELLERVPRRTGEIAGTLGSRLETREATPGRTVVALVLVAGCLWSLVRRRAPADFFAVGVLALIAVYFGFEERLLAPIYLLALPATADGLRALVGRFAPPRVALAVPALALVGLALLDLAPRRDWERIGGQSERLEALCRDVKAALPPDARLAAGVGWHYAVFLDLPVYSVDFAVRRRGDASALEQVVDRYGLNTLLLSPANPRDLPVLPYVRDRYQRAQKVREAFLVRVRP